jgi:hypothetical protein
MARVINPNLEVVVLGTAKGSDKNSPLKGRWHPGRRRQRTLKPFIFLAIIVNVKPIRLGILAQHRKEIRTIRGSP